MHARRRGGGRRGRRRRRRTLDEKREGGRRGGVVEGGGNEGRNERDRKAWERDPYDCWHQAVCSAHLAIPASNASLPRLPARHLTRSRTFTNTYERRTVTVHSTCVHNTTMSLAVAPEESVPPYFGHHRSNYAPIYRQFLSWNTCSRGSPFKGGTPLLREGPRDNRFSVGSTWKSEMISKWKRRVVCSSLSFTRHFSLSLSTLRVYGLNFHVAYLGC